MTQSREDFVNALEKDDLELQYELLTHAVANPTAATGILDAIEQRMPADQRPRPMDWKALRKRAHQAQRARRLVHLLTTGGFASRQWNMILPLLTVVSAVAAVSLVWAAAVLPTDHVLGDTVLLAALFCAATMVLSAAALMSGASVPKIGSDSMMIVPVLVGVLRPAAIIVATGAALWAGTTFVVSSPTRVTITRTLATITPGNPLEFDVDAKRGGRLTVTASDVEATLHLTLFDLRNRQLTEQTGRSINIELPKGLRGVRAELSTTRATAVAVNTRPGGS